MRKIVALPLIAALALSVTACAKNARGDNVSETTLNETVTDTVSTADELGGNATLSNDADLDANTSAVTISTQ